jgi:DNA-directed RNA polymerase specialized sigma24 family protein
MHPTDAELVRAYGHRVAYREQDRVRLWLWRIPTNRCRPLAAARAHRPQPQRHKRFDRLADADASPETELDRRALGLRPCTPSPTEQRKAVLLRHAHSFSLRAISALTGADVSARTVRVARACERLRGLLEKHHINASTKPLSDYSAIPSDRDA